MDDFVKKFIDVYERASSQRDFYPRNAIWLIDPSTWHLVVKSRFGAHYVVFGQPGDGNKLMDFPVRLIGTRDIEVYDFTSEVPPTSIPQPDPTLICLQYEGDYAFSRYVVSSVSDAKFRRFDTTGFFNGVSEEA